MVNRYATFDSPLDKSCSSRMVPALPGFTFSGQKYEPVPGPGWCREPDLAIFRDASLQLREYFRAGRHRQFDLPLHLQGTPFRGRSGTPSSRSPSVLR